MKSLGKYKVILWDFDGVILDSMPVRELGFRMVLKNYPTQQVEKLIEFHQANGGWSRFVKLRYFYEEIRNEQVDEDQIQSLSKEFSALMKSKLTSRELLISDSVDFIKKNNSQFQMHIVSGSEHIELNYLCAELGITSYFLSINGSPTPKKVLVSNLLKKYAITPNDVVLIGDAKNDFEAASTNNIDFVGYNNLELRRDCNYIDSFRFL